MFLSAAYDGKKLVGVDEGFKLDNTYTGSNGWKVTLKDAYDETSNPSGIMAPTNVTVTQTKTGGVDQKAAEASGEAVIDLTNGVAVTYGNLTVKATATALSDTKADFVSAILKDETEGSETKGQYVQYAKVSGNATALENGVSVAIDAKQGGTDYLADGTYTMYVFAEKIGKNENGETDKMTDYASEFGTAEDGTTKEFTIHKGSETVFEDKLSKDHASKKLTFKLGNNFNLSFDSGTYNTGVTVENNKVGKITADATNGTTLTGAVNVGSGATLITVNAFTLKGTNTIAGTLTGDAVTISAGETTVASTGSIANALTVNGGTLLLDAGKYGVNDGVKTVNLTSGTLKFTGGTLGNAITGTADVVVAGEVSSGAANFINTGTLSIASGTLTLTGETLAKNVTGEGTTVINGVVESTVKISTAIKINNGKSLKISANNLDGAVTNDGTLTLTGSNVTLASNITKSDGSSGKTIIDGTVKSNAKISTAIKINGEKSLEISANNIGAAVKNDGTLTLDGGKLAQQVSEATSGQTGTIDLQKATEIAAQISNQNIKLTDGYSKVANESYIANNNLIFNGGGFDFQNGKTENYSVENIDLTNAAGYLKLDVDLANGTMDTLNATDVSGEQQIHITAFNVLSDATKDKTKVLFTTTAGLKDKVVSDFDKVTSTVSQAVYNVKYKETGAVANDTFTGNFIFTKTGANETTKSVSDTINVVNLVWLESVSNLQKRLGDLRNDAESNTGWARFQRNMDDLNTGRSLNVAGNLYQIGYNFALKNDTQARGYFGLSLEHFDGTQSFGIGNGDLKSTSVGAYYTKIYNSGHYFDFVLRYGKYDSDTTSYDAGLSTKLDYAVKGVTLSGEYGYRAKLGKSGLYLEPQAEFIYGYLSGAKKTSSTGILTDIDSTNRFVSRFGVALGQQVKNFNYYLRGSYYHDFAGTTNITYGDTSYKQDSAQNWWEVSLGGG